MTQAASAVDISPGMPAVIRGPATFFFAYCKHVEDENRLKELEKRLKALGQDVLLDRHWGSGRDIDAVAKNSIERASVVVCFVAPERHASDGTTCYVEKELNYAEAGRKHVYPIGKGVCRTWKGKTILAWEEYQDQIVSHLLALGIDCVVPKEGQIRHLRIQIDRNGARRYFLERCPIARCPAAPDWEQRVIDVAASVQAAERRLLSSMDRMRWLRVGRSRAAENPALRLPEKLLSLLFPPDLLRALQRFPDVRRLSPDQLPVRETDHIRDFQYRISIHTQDAMLASLPWWSILGEQGLQPTFELCLEPDECLREVPHARALRHQFSHKARSKHRDRIVKLTSPWRQQSGNPLHLYLNDGIDGAKDAEAQGLCPSVAYLNLLHKKQPLEPGEVPFARTVAKVVVLHRSYHGTDTDDMAERFFRGCWGDFAMSDSPTSDPRDVCRDMAALDDFDRLMLMVVTNPSARGDANQIQQSGYPPVSTMAVLVPDACSGRAFDLQSEYLASRDYPHLEVQFDNWDDKNVDRFLARALQVASASVPKGTAQLWIDWVPALNASRVQSSDRKLGAWLKRWEEAHRRLCTQRGKVFFCLPSTACLGGGLSLAEKRLGLRIRVLPTSQTNTTEVP